MELNFTHFWRRNILHLPKPTDTGSTSNVALSMEDWNIYEEFLQFKYPIRYFLGYSIWRKIINPIKRLCSNGYWWIRHHTINRYHYLDLRQPKFRNGLPNWDAYSYGWRDRDQIMLYAMFNVLCQFVEKELHYQWADEILKEFHNHYNAQMEMKALYQYWTMERNAVASAKDVALSKWYNTTLKTGQKEEELYQEYTQLEREFQDREDEMCMRLLKIRKYLWT